MTSALRRPAASISRRENPLSRSCATASPANTAAKLAAFSKMNTKLNDAYPPGKSNPGVWLSAPSPAPITPKKISGATSGGMRRAGLRNVVRSVRPATPTTARRYVRVSGVSPVSSSFIVPTSFPARPPPRRARAR